jgi:hypothetical protein
VDNLEGGQHGGPHEVARGGDVVALVGLVRLLPAQSVGEGVVELLLRESHRPVAVGGVLQEREERADLCDRGYPDALCRRGVYDHACCPVSVVGQDLDYQTAHRVVHEDGRLLQLGYEVFVVLDDPRDGQSLHRGGVLV